MIQYIMVILAFCMYMYEYYVITYLGHINATNNTN